MSYPRLERPIFDVDVQTFGFSAWGDKDERRPEEEFGRMRHQFRDAISTGIQPMDYVTDVDGERPSRPLKKD